MKVDFKLAFSDPDARYFFSPLHLFCPWSSPNKPFTVPYTIFSKSVTFHKGIHTLDHLCPYNSEEKDNICASMLFSCGLCCTETAQGPRQAGITTESQCNTILPQVLYGELIRPTWLRCESATVALSGIWSAEVTKNSEGRKRVSLVPWLSYMNMFTVLAQWFTFIGHREYSCVKNWDKHAGKDQKCVWQATKSAFLPSHSVLVKASCPQVSFWCLLFLDYYIFNLTPL